MDYPVSIIIAAYNIEEFISDCLFSCINQTYGNIEIVVVNDGSSDRTGQICDEYSEKDSRIVVINKQNEGLVRARETGLNNSSNQFVFFLDGDDSLPANAIEFLVNAADEDTDIVLGEHSVIFQNGTSKLRTLDFTGSTNIDLINSIFKSAVPNIFGHLYSKRLFNDVIFHTNLYRSIGEDLVTVIQLAYAANKIVKIPYVTCNYYRRDNSITLTAGKNVYALGFNAFAIVTRFLKEKNLLEKVKGTYFNLLKTFVTGYLNSNISIELYKKELQDSVDFVISNWADFAISASLNERIFFRIAKSNLAFARFVIIQYNKYNTFILKRSS